MFMTDSHLGGNIDLEDPTMNPASVSTAKTNEYNLLHLLTEVRGDGRAVEHFVCWECMELAEKSAETETIHECPAYVALAADPLGETQASASS